MVGPPSQPLRRNSATRKTTVASSSPIPTTKKLHVGASQTPNHVGEVLPEEPREEAEWQEDRGDDRQLLHDDVEAVRHCREVRVHDAREQVPVAVDQVRQADHVVVEVSEVPHRLIGHARTIRHAGVDARHHVPLGCDDLPHLHQRALHVEELAQLCLGRRLEDVVLQRVDAIVERRQEGEERVHEGSDDQVDDDDLRRRGLRCGVPLQTLVHVREGRALSSVHGHHVAVRPKAVHFGGALLVRIGTPGDQVDEVVVLVDAGTLREALGRADGQRVEPEVDTQELGHGPVAVDVVEVEPEEARAGQGLQHTLGRRRLLTAPLTQRPLQHVLSLIAPGRVRVDDAVAAVPARTPQAKRPGSNAAGSGGSSPGSALPVMSCASTRAE